MKNCEEYYKELALVSSYIFANKLIVGSVISTFDRFILLQKDLLKNIQLGKPNGKTWIYVLKKQLKIL